MFGRVEVTIKLGTTRIMKDWILKGEEFSTIDDGFVTILKAQTLLPTVPCIPAGYWVFLLVPDSVRVDL